MGDVQIHGDMYFFFSLSLSLSFTPERRFVSAVGGIRVTAVGERFLPQYEKEEEEVEVEEVGPMAWLMDGGGRGGR